MARTGEGRGGTPKGYWHLALRKGLAKATEARHADIGAQPLRRRLVGNPFLARCVRAHPVGVAPEPTADW